MVACASIPWDITLNLDSDPEITETIGFRDVSISNGVITGNVFDEGEEFMSVLRGRCTPSVVAGQPEMSHLNFVFTVRDRREATFLMLLDGVAFLTPGSDKQEFHGQFRAYLPFGDILVDPLGNPAGAALAPGHLDELAFDEGETGTGNGTQT